MIDLLTRRWWLVLLRGVAAILFGVVALVWPGVTLLALIVLWGAYALVDGVTAVVIGIAHRRDGGTVSWTYGLLGVAGVIAGTAALVWPGLTAIVLLTIIAGWALVTGVVQVVEAIRLRKMIEHEWFLGVTGVLTAALGAVLLLRPGVGAVAVITTIGVFAILWGATLALLSLRLRSVGKQYAASAAASADWI